MSNVLETVKEALSEVSPHDFQGVTTETELAEFGLDSLALAEMVFELEDRLGVSIENEQMESIKTVGDLCELIRAH